MLNQFLEPSTLFAILFLGIIPFTVMRGLLKEFRKNIKCDDIVGVRFGDYTLNRKVRSITDTTVQVKAFNGTNYVSVPKTNVYVPDRYAPIDEVVNLEDEE